MPNYPSSWTTLKTQDFHLLHKICLLCFIHSHSSVTMSWLEANSSNNALSAQSLKSYFL